MPEVILTQLIAQATKLMHEQNYDDRIIKYEVSVWRGFQKFCDSKGYAHYSSSCKDEFITELRNSTHPLKDSTIARKLAALKKLDLLASRGSWTKGELNPLPELPSEFNDFLDKQDEYLVKTGHSVCSRDTMRKSVAFAMRYFISIGVEHLSDIDNTRISAYLLTLGGHAKSTVRGELSRLRMFLSYLHLFGYTTENLSGRIPQYRLGNSQSMVKIWGSDEINKVLETIDRSSPKGKRDFAMVSIAAELGVRSKDICDLKLTDIDWELCSISFVQSKTGKPNTLPLSEKIGAAIIDYLRVRPQTVSQYLFVNLNPPYGRIKSFNSSFEKYVARSGVKVQPEAHHGLHSLRATLATKLLSVDVSPDVIFSFLGHTDRNSLSHYLRLDVENLRECALSFEDGELI
ncbi:MAG: tyrosine-type recombinase/integrase [Oscillospiraceae bacterium]